MSNGRKPLSQKASAKPAPFHLDDIFGNAMSIDPELVKVLDKQGQSYRFVSVTKLQSMGGYHERGWTPVSKEQLSKWGYVTIDTSALFGSSPDNFIRRGDSVLAVRPKELNEKHKAYLRQEAQRGRNVQKTHADELRNHVKSLGIDKDTTIEDGYGEEETN